MKMAFPLKFLVVPALICLALIWKFRWNDAPHKTPYNIVDGDGAGFYAWLPAIFIYGDVSFEYLEREENAEIKSYVNERFLLEHKGKTVLKTPSGVAIMQSPFFLSTLALRKITGKNSTGYEGSFQKAISVGAFFYLFAGLIFYIEILRRIIKTKYALALSVLALLFGTNLLFYGLFHPTMTHIYSFFLIGAFSFCAVRWKETSQNKFLYFIALLLGLIYLVRPVNLLIPLILPFILGGWKEVFTLLKTIFKKPIASLIIILLFGLVISVQFILNYVQCGDFFVWSYKGEGFRFNDPHISDVLFSYNHGLFVYTPLALVSLIALFTEFKKNSIQKIHWLLFFALVIFVMSSWWNWYYGSSFGMRPMVDYYLLWFLPLPFLLEGNILKKTISSVLILLCIGLNLVQTYQFNHNIIYPEDMDAEKYNFVFLKTSKEYENVLGGGNEPSAIALENRPFSSHSIDSQTITDLDQNSEFACTFHIPYQEKMSLPFHLTIDLERLELDSLAGTKAVIVVAVSNSSGVNYRYNSFKINDHPYSINGQWKKFDYSLRMAALRSKTDEVAIYIYNPDKLRMKIKQFDVKFFGERK
jgi:hypothetical protein